VSKENESKGGAVGEDAKLRRAWATNLSAFAGKLRDLENHYRICVNPSSRKKIWSEFNSGPGSELAAWILSADAKTISVDENGEFTIPECSNLDKNSATRYLVISTRVNGDSVFLAWDSEIFRQSRNPIYANFTRCLSSS
jgi:hypothetical protein